MLFPTLAEAKQLAAGYQVLPVALEVFSDTLTPIRIYQALSAQYDCCFLLESAENAEKWGRYSFIGIAPKLQLTIRDNTATVQKDGTVTRQAISGSGALIRELLAAYKSPKVKNLPKFTGGLVGYFAYDTVREVEKKLSNPPPDDLEMPDCHLLLCDEIVAYDHLRHRTLIILNIPADIRLGEHYAAAEKRAEQLAAAIRSFPETPPKAKPKEAPVVSGNITRDEYMKSVSRAKEYIVDGDIFQVVLSRRIEISNPPDAFDTYRTLRATNPSPYMYYFKMKEYEIAGSSPEMLVSVQSGEIFNRPIAGTIRRGRTETEDKELESELLCDKKEQAEHTMLVDLGRNDVGKVSQFGSVEVGKFMSVEKYSQVMHLVTDVKGKLQDGKDCVDALTAVLPAGTLSGAPKVRAMEIIDELEKNRRGLYGGTVGYIGFDGDMDTCIAIRTVLYKGGKAYIQTGAGIVYDSDPEKEFLETENKAKALIKAILEAGDLQ